MAYFLGIDIGGTKTSVGIFDENVVCVAEKTFPTDSLKGAKNLVGRISDTYRLLLDENNKNSSDILAAGVGCPGPLELKTGRIVHIPTMGFKDVPIAKMLEDAIGKPVFLENDANCAALAEAVLGAGKSMNPVAYVTVSTGIGCGMVVDGKILDGFSDCAGELGHITVERNGSLCPCGKRGCLEMYSSGTAISRIATEKYGRVIGTKELFDMARKNDLKAVEIIREATDYLGYGLSALCTVLNPQVIVLGGSVTKDYDLFADWLSESFIKYTQPQIRKNTKIVLSRFDGYQVLYGAVLNAMGKINS